MDDEVVYWVEAAEAFGWADIWQAMTDREGNALGARLVRDDAFIAFWLEAMDISLFNRCVGLGALAPATEEALDRAIEPFRAAGRTQFTMQVSPFASPARLESWLVARGFVPGRRWAKLWRETTKAAAERTDLRIERIDQGRRDEFVRVTLAAFEMPEDLAPFASATIGRPGWHHYLSFDRDAAVGAAAMRVADGVAWLGFGSTLPTHRGRGSQSALLSRRIRDAEALGARLAITETGEDIPDEPNPSYRNMLRAGFHLGYLRRNWLPPSGE